MRGQLVCPRVAYRRQRRVTRAKFLALASKVANEKARELGWIV